MEKEVYELHSDIQGWIDRDRVIADYINTDKTKYYCNSRQREPHERGGCGGAAGAPQWTVSALRSPSVSDRTNWEEASHTATAEC